jgi:hypothetical protein
MSNQAKPAPTTPTGTPARSSTPTGQQHYGGIPHDRIAKRAYEKWCQHGCPHGTHQQDWLEAEAELRAEMSGTSMPRSTQPTPTTQPAAMPQKTAPRH